MKCVKCGARVKSGERFCPVCGNRLDDKKDEEFKKQKITYESKDKKITAPTIQNKSDDMKDEENLDNYLVLSDKNKNLHEDINQKTRDPDFENISKNNPDESDKDKKKLYILATIALLLVLLVVYFLNNREKTEYINIDLSDYIDVKFEGSDGAGRADASFLKDKFIEDYKEKIVYKDKNKRNDNYPNAASELIASLEKNTTFNYSKDGKLTNGEEMQVAANIGDLGIKEEYNVILNEKIKSVIVNNLVTTSIIDPFLYIDVSFDGKSPNASIVINLRKDAPNFMKDINIIANKTNRLSLGEEVNVSLDYDEKELFDKYNIKFSSKDRSYEVKDVEVDQEIKDNTDSEYIKSLNELSEDVLGKLKANAGNFIRDSFDERNYTKIGSIDYIGLMAGFDPNSESDIKNNVVLMYSITADEDYEGKYQRPFTYYTYIKFQNVRTSVDEDGNFYSNSPLTTNNEVIHKFFVEEDYTYYEIAYYGFGYLEDDIDAINDELSDLRVEKSITSDLNNYFVKSNQIAGEYEGDGTRLTLFEDNTLRYMINNRLHLGIRDNDEDNLTFTIEGVNIDKPIRAIYQNGSIKVDEDGEMKAQIFKKIEEN